MTAPTTRGRGHRSGLDHEPVRLAVTGGVYAGWLLPQAGGALVQTVLGKIAGELFHEARRAGLRQAHEAYQAEIAPMASPSQWFD